MKLIIISLIYFQIISVEPRSFATTSQHGTAVNSYSRYHENARRLWRYQPSAEKRAKQQLLADKVEKLLRAKGNPKVEQAKQELQRQLEVNFVKFLSVILLATPEMNAKNQDDLLRVMRETLNGMLDFKPVVNKLPELLRQDQPNRLLLLLRTIEPVAEDPLRHLTITKQEQSEESTDEYSTSGEENPDGQFPEDREPGNSNEGNQQQGGGQQGQKGNQPGGNPGTGGNGSQVASQNSVNNNKQQGNQNGGNKQQQVTQTSGNQGNANPETAAPTTVATTTPAPNNWDAIIEALGKIDIKEVGTFLKEIPAIFEGIQAIIDGVEEFF